MTRTRSGLPSPVSTGANQVVYRSQRAAIRIDDARSPASSYSLSNASIQCSTIKLRHGNSLVDPVIHTANALTPAGPTRCHQYLYRIRPFSIRASTWVRSPVKNVGALMIESGCTHGILHMEKSRCSIDGAGTWGLLTLSLGVFGKMPLKDGG